MKKAISLFLALMLCVGLCCVPVTAETTATGRSNTVYNDSHVAYIDENGVLWAWWLNSKSPVRVMEDVASFSLSGTTLAIIRTDGSLWMICSNGDGQYGNGTYNPSGNGIPMNIVIEEVPLTPVKVMDDVTAVSVGGDFVMALKADGSLWVWGSNFFGDLGYGAGGDTLVSYVETHEQSGNSISFSYYLQTRPKKIMEGVAEFRNFYNNTEGYTDHIFAAIKTDGSLWVWGSNENGFLGFGAGGNALVGYDYISLDDGIGHIVHVDYHVQATPKKLMDGVVDFRVNNDVYAAVKADGSLWMWGDNGYCKLGLGGDVYLSERGYLNGADQPTPQRVMGGVASVSFGVNITAAVGTDGSLWTWGFDGYGWGLLGSGGKGNATDAHDNVYQTVPAKIINSGIASADVSDTRCYALKTDGTLLTWGGGIGVRDPDNTTPMKLMDGVAAVYGSGFGLKTDGTLWTWGEGEHFWGPFVDDGGYGVLSTPTQIPGVRAKLPGTFTFTVRGENSDAPGVGNSAALGVTVNGKAVEWTDAEPFIDENSRTLVPLRTVGGAMDLTVDWDNAKREAVFTSADGAKSIRFPIGEKVAYTTEGTKAMDTAAIIRGGRTYAPARALAEYFGYTVDWNGDTKTVIITGGAA